MNRRARRHWLLFAAGTALGLVGLSLVTAHMLRTHEQGQRAAIAAQWQEDVRTALYRMDQRFAPLFARATARTEHVETALETLQFELRLPDGVATPVAEPLAGEQPLLALADTNWANGVDTGPQIDGLMPEEMVDNGYSTRGTKPLQLESRAHWRSAQEFVNRQNLNMAQNVSNSIPVYAGELLTGPFATSWRLDEDPPLLVFARRIQLGETSAHQRFYVDWNALQETLLSEIEDLFPDAELEPTLATSESFEEVGDRLATLPARLVVPAPSDQPVTDPTLRTTLWTAWLLGLVGLCGFGFALRSGLADAARQRRFTSAVTHELRTPLTTFRLYSEMLKEGMVPEERRAEYLDALEEESGRLAALVENVLEHARLEDGRSQRARESLALGTLVERHRSTLERRCARSSARLDIELGDAANLSVATDVEGVGQILSNLVDNACKYGAPPEGHHAGAPLVLRGRCEEHSLALLLSDPGPGIPPSKSRAIFRPFDRAGRDEGDAAPGVGLGLALCRDLAAALGGSLELERSDAPGATFCLRLPRG